MPYYKWTGIDLMGNIRTGKQPARSSEHLTVFLFNQDIAVIKVKPQKKILSLKRTAQALFFRQLGVLLNAGIRLFDALVIAKKTVHDNHFNYIINDCAQAVHEGIPLSKACEYHYPVFDTLTIKLIAAGEESGNLKQALDHLANYFEKREQYRKQVREALMVPLLIIIVFFALVLFIFLVIVPRFEAIFATLNKPLPWATQLIFSFSKSLRSLKIIFAALGFLAIFFSFYYINKILKLHSYKDYIIVCIPGIRTIIQDFSLLFFLQSLTLLLEGGVHLVNAVNSAAQLISNSVLRKTLVIISQEVDTGVPLSQAFMRHKFTNSPELSALIVIGESSGSLSTMVDQAAGIYQQRVARLLTRCTNLIQPILLVVLGLCIGGLIIALYLPLFTLTTLVG